MRQGFTNEIRRSVGEAQNWTCYKCLKPIASYHHKLANIKENRLQFPLFLNSPFNCVGLCKECHEQRAHLFRITIQEAEVYEDWLQTLKRA